MGRPVVQLPAIDCSLARRGTMPRGPAHTVLFPLFPAALSSHETYLRYILLGRQVGDAT